MNKKMNLLNDSTITDENLLDYLWDRGNYILADTKIEVYFNPVSIDAENADGHSNFYKLEEDMLLVDVLHQTIGDKNIFNEEDEYRYLIRILEDETEEVVFQKLANEFKSPIITNNKDHIIASVKGTDHLNNHLEEILNEKPFVFGLRVSGGGAEEYLLTDKPKEIIDAAFNYDLCVSDIKSYGYTKYLLALDRGDGLAEFQNTVTGDLLMIDYKAMISDMDYLEHPITVDVNMLRDYIVVEHEEEFITPKKALNSVEVVLMVNGVKTKKTIDLDSYPADLNKKEAIRYLTTAFMSNVMNDLVGPEIPQMLDGEYTEELQEEFNLYPTK